MTSEVFSFSLMVKVLQTLVKRSVGTAEILLDQSRELKDSLTNIGSEVSLKLYKNMCHTFWNHPFSIPEAYQLIEDISVWLANK